MTVLAPITPQLDETTRAEVARLARQQGISDAEFAADAIHRATQEAPALSAGLQEGIAAVDCGELISQAQIVAWFEERSAARSNG